MRFLTVLLAIGSAFAIFLTSAPASLASFPDVPSTHPNAEAIEYVQGEGIVSGHPDGSYKPDLKINRAEFTKIIVEALPNMRPHIRETCFPDVPADSWFHEPVCLAKHWGIIGGYPDGTFKPAQNISFVEAAKIIATGFGLSIAPDQNIWYKPFVRALGEQKAIPTSITDFEHKITRGEMAEMIYRLKAEGVNKSSQTYETLAGTPSPPTPPIQTSIPNIDLSRVRQTWLDWLNGARADQSLAPYSYDDRLHQTALTWSQLSAEKGEMSHQRNPGDSYYDYSKIEQWFKDQGLTFKNVNRVTFTENIGWGTYRCSESDCTDKLIEAIRITFDFYMAEKNKEYKPHYNSIMNQYFQLIGLGIVARNGKYFLTVHYATEITSG
ncbi:MAG: S-layer homology domain-containing protein [bacterium]|nr:S-layer homology domain-containing protein [bacterium]